MGGSEWKRLMAAMKSPISQRNQRVRNAASACRITCCGNAD